MNLFIKVVHQCFHSVCQHLFCNYLVTLQLAAKLFKVLAAIDKSRDVKLVEATTHITLIEIYGEFGHWVLGWCRHNFRVFLKDILLLRNCIDRLSFLSIELSRVIQYAQVFSRVSSSRYSPQKLLDALFCLVNPNCWFPVHLMVNC